MLTQIGASDHGRGVKRIYYTDEEGRLVERILHDSDDILPVFKQNAEDRENFKKHGSNMRKVASVPTTLMLKWLHEANLPGWGGAEVMDYVYNKKIRDPENKFVLTVPDNYGFKRYE